MNEIFNMLTDSWNYVSKAFTKFNSIIGSIWAGISYIIIPDKAYIPIIIVLFIATIMDILTKYYRLSKAAGGFFKALQDYVIRSDIMWEGTKKKFISILVVMILCGLFYRLIPINGVAIIPVIVIYTVMFLRECQSIIENLISCGHDDLSWLLGFLKKKEKDMLDNDSNYVYNSDKEITNDNNEGEDHTI